MQFQKYQKTLAGFQKEQGQKPSGDLGDLDVTRDKVRAANDRYKALKCGCESLLDGLQIAQDRQRQFQQAKVKLEGWLDTAEVQVAGMKTEPIQAEPQQMQQQLDSVKSFGTEVITQGRQVDDLQKAARALDESLQKLGAEQESLQQVENTVSQLKDRADDITAGTTARSHELQTALVQSQGVQEGMDGLLTWLQDIQNTVNSMRPISLSQGTLQDQMRDMQVVRSDIESHLPSMEAMRRSSTEVAEVSDPKMAKVIKDKLADLEKKFNDVAAKCKQREDDLQDVSDKLNSFHEAAKRHQDWLVPAFDALDSKDTTHMDTPEFKDKVAEIAADVHSHESDLEALRRMGQELIKNPKTTDVVPIKDALTHMEQNWHDLNEVLSERQKEAEFRHEQGSRYDQVKAAVLRWLTDTEAKVDQLQPVAIDLKVIERQIEELQPLLTEYEDFAPTIDEVNDLGNTYDALQRGDQAASPIRRSMYFVFSSVVAYTDLVPRVSCLLGNLQRYRYGMAITETSASAVTNSQ